MAGIVYDEHVSMRATVAGLTEPHVDRPDFRPSISDTGLFPAGDKANSAVLIIGTIYNQGSPGNLNDVYIEVVFDDGKKMSVEIANPLDPRIMVNLGKNNQGKTMGMPGRLYWLNERSILIQKFGRLDVFAMGLLRGASLEQLKAKRPTFVLTCTDITQVRGLKWSHHFMRSACCRSHR